MTFRAILAGSEVTIRCTLESHPGSRQHYDAAFSTKWTSYE